MTLHYDCEVQTSFILLIFHLLAIIFIRSHQFDQKTGIVLTGSFNFYLRLNLDTPKLVSPKPVNKCQKQTAEGDQQNLS